MCILHWLHRGNGSGTSYNMATLNFQCQNMKCSLNLPVFFALAGKPSTGHSTNFGIRGNYNL